MKYKAKTLIRKDGKDYEAGDIIELDETEAEKMKAIKAIDAEAQAEPAAKTDARAAAEAKTKAEANAKAEATDKAEANAKIAQVDTLVAITSVLSDLKEGDFKGDGYPKVKRVEALLKGKVDPALVNASLVATAWDASEEKTKAEAEADKST